MKTCHFDFECGVCKEHRNRKREVLMCILDEDVTDNIIFLFYLLRLFRNTKSMRRFRAKINTTDCARFKKYIVYLTLLISHTKS